MRYSFCIVPALIILGVMSHCVLLLLLDNLNHAKNKKRLKTDAYGLKRNFRSFLNETMELKTVFLLHEKKEQKGNARHTESSACISIQRPVTKKSNTVLNEAGSLKIAIVRNLVEEDLFADGVEFILYIGSFQKPDQAVMIRFKEILQENPHVSAVGGRMLENDTLFLHCHALESCHWTLMIHYEYKCSDGPFMQCDSTSPIFMTRSKYKSVITESTKMGGLAPLHFFMKLKELSAIVVTDVSTHIHAKVYNDIKITTDHKQQFVLSNAIDHIKHKEDTGTEKGRHWWKDGFSLELCTNSTCDAKIVSEIFSGKSWATTGATMPIFAYKAYVTAFQRAVKFLNDNKVEYRVTGGADLGLLKLGHLLPWDSGDVDILVDVSQFGCKRWMSMLKSWADSYHMKHPHISPAGQTCYHYGVYAMPEEQDNGNPTNLKDPWSIGLVTFSDITILKTKIDQVHWVFGHGVHARVSRNQWQALEQKYSGDLLHQKTHSNAKHKCTVSARHRHNCIVDEKGIHLDSCIDDTFFEI